VDVVYKLLLASIPKQFGTLRYTRTTYNKHLYMIDAYAITFKLRRLSVMILLVLCQDITVGLMRQIRQMD